MLSPGAELDSLIAEKLYGWHRYSSFWIDSANKVVCAAYDFYPSTNIEDAFKVLDKMIELGWIEQWRLETDRLAPCTDPIRSIDYEYDLVDRYYVCLGDVFGTEYNIKDCGPDFKGVTAAHAICLLVWRIIDCMDLI